MKLAAFCPQIFIARLAHQVPRGIAALALARALPQLNGQQHRLRFSYKNKTGSVFALKHVYNLQFGTRK